MTRSLLLVLVLLFLVAWPACGDDLTAEDRFHEAYVLEVVDGKVAEAARAYLELRDDEVAPVDVRSEARFRFAVCTVLLGRPDEGRLQLAELLRADATPAATKVRAREYLDSLADIGMGTELEKKFESLVYDLGRVDPAEPVVPPYRDFEIIGDSAIPLLEKLVAHPDAKLRRHAFRLLCRVGAEGVVDRWTAEFGLEDPLGAELDRYLATRPAQFRLLETKLLALDEASLRKVFEGGHPEPSGSSMSFVRELWLRPLVRGWGIHFLHHVGEEPERWRFVGGALLEGDTDTSAAAAQWMLGHEAGPPEELVEALWPRFLDRVLEMRRGWSSKGAPRGSTSGNLMVYACRIPAVLLLDSLEGLVKAGEAWTTGRKGHPLTRGLADLIAYAYEAKGAEVVDFPRYEALLRRWTNAIPELRGQNVQSLARGLLEHLEFVIDHAPRPQGDAFLEWVLQGPARGQVQEFDQIVNVRSPADVRRVLHAMAALDRDQREYLSKRLPPVWEQEASLEMRRAVVEALPDLLGLTHPAAIRAYTKWLFHAVRGMETEEQLRSLEGLLRVALDLGDGALSSVMRSCFTLVARDRETQVEHVRFTCGAGLMSLDRVWEDLPSRDRFVALDLLHGLASGQLWDRRRALDVLESAERERLESFVQERIAEVPSKSWRLVRLLLPLEAWLWHAPHEVRRNLVVSSSEADRVVAALAASDRAVTDRKVLDFAAKHASDDVKRELFERGLGSTNDAARRAVLGAARGVGWDATPQVLEKALDLALASKRVSLSEVGQLAYLVIDRHPSEKLFPAIRVLLAHDGHARTGIDLAGSLGQEELVQDLVPFLDSMDVKLRTAARKAVASIREVARVKEEVAKSVPAK